MQIYPTLDLEAATPARRALVEIEVIEEETLALLYEAVDRATPVIVLDRRGRSIELQVLKITSE